MIVLETGDFKCGPFVLQPLSDREFASYPFHFFGNGLVQNPRVYFVVLMSVCPSIFTTDSIEILLASATVANVCLAIKWCYKINFELCKKRKGLQDWRPSLVIRLGFEPRTPSLKGMCSTSWASESPSNVNQFPDCECKGNTVFSIVQIFQQVFSKYFSIRAVNPLVFNRFSISASVRLNGPECSNLSDDIAAAKHPASAIEAPQARL